MVATSAREAAPPAESAAEPTTTLREWRGVSLVGGFTLAHLAHHVCNSLLNPLLPYIRDAFGLSYAQSGLLVSAYSMSLGLSNAPLGVLADRIGSRLVIVFGLILTGIVGAALAFAQAYWQLLLLLVLLGVVSGTYHAPSSALLARAFPARVRGAAMGLHITGGHLSFFAAPVAAAALVSATGSWRTPYLWLAAAPLVAGVVMWFLAPSDRAAAAARRQTGGSPWAALTDVWGVARLVGPLISVSVLFQVVYAALMAFVTSYLIDVRGVPGPAALVLFALPQLVGIIGAPLAGTLSDRLGRRTVILIGVAALGPAFLALALVPGEWAVLPLVAIGLVAPLRQTVTEVFVTESAPAHRRATVLGTYYMLSQELGGLAAPLFGLLATVVQIGPAFTIVSAGMAVASLLVLLAQRRL